MLPSAPSDVNLPRILLLLSSLCGTQQSCSLPVGGNHASPNIPTSPNWEREGEGEKLHLLQYRCKRARTKFCCSHNSFWLRKYVILCCLLLHHTWPRLFASYVM
ncbi:hypothetical protein B0H63DRAFT_463124 [Podospora didyma]|uniref:Secreted protein n=1 Tax=Podospora didyma TaxID=330526 RepID=A0AAE0NWM8_9PEZI|nr:hypothetical protein B0H63DRAFT_463124 [Podospora didyma]